MCLIVIQCAPMCSKAGKEGQTSNQFKEDLFQIIDFLDVNKREINQIFNQVQKEAQEPLTASEVGKF
jgi:hypothetical protein